MNLLPPPGPQRSRLLVMLGLLVVALAVFGWRYAPWRTAAAPGATSNSPSAGPPTAPQSSVKPAAGSKPAAGPAMPQPVNLGKLEPVPDEPGSGRNLFRFGTRPLPPAPPQPPPPPAPKIDPGPPPVTGPPPIDLEFKGLLKTPAATFAQLRDPKSGAFYQGVEGQVLDGKYKVLKIGEQSVIVAYVDGSGQRTLMMR